MILERTLASDFLPGANVKGGVSGANWTFLLPNLELERIVCLGVPTAATLVTLARIGAEVSVACETRREVGWAQKAIAGAGKPNVTVRHRETASAAGLPDEGADLVLFGRPDGARRLASEQPLADEVRRLLKPDGLLYVEPDGGETGPIDRAGLAVRELFRLVPERGEVESAVPAHDEAAGAFAARAFGATPAAPRRRLSPRRLPMRRRRPDAPRWGALAGRDREGLPDGPPRYVCTVAAEGGLDLAGRRWALSTRGRYASKKVVFVVFEDGSDTPELVVKVTRSEAFNARLENEYAALAELERRGLVDPDTVPTVAFFGHHGGLAVLGQTAIDGVPLRLRARLEPDCTVVARGIDTLIDLAVRTADGAGAAPDEVALALDGLLARYEAVYRPSPAERDLLREQIETVRSSVGRVPLVFQHGDAGMWNAFATTGGGVAFLDWEAAEPSGLPLWDLVYFVRSVGVWSARAAGVGNSLKAFERQFLADTDSARLLAAAVRRVCDRLDLSPALVEPLVTTCWMHRALKEATRLPHDRLDSGHYVNLLRLCLRHRHAPGLRRLYAADAAGTAA